MEERLEQMLDGLNKPVTKEVLEKLIYCMFCFAIFITPVIPEVKRIGIYSLKATLFNFATIFTTISLLIINIKKIKFKFNIYNILMVTYLVLVVLSTIFTKYGIVDCILGKNGRGEGLITIFSYIMTLVIFSKGVKYMRGVSKVAIFSAIVISIYAILQANVIPGLEISILPKSPTNIATGTMRNQNFLSSYVCMLLPMSALYYINATKNKIQSLIISTLLFITLILAVTLGGYVTFVAMYIAVITVSLIFNKNKKETIKRIIIISLVFIVIFVLLTLLNGETYFKELFGATQEVQHLMDGDDSFGTSRMEIWRKTIMVIQKYPLLGVGPDSLWLELSNREYITNGKQDILSNYIVDKAHSEPLHMAVTTGIPSAVIYLVLATLICLGLLKELFKGIKEEGIASEKTMYKMLVLTSILSYLMQSMINISVVQVAPMFWAILGTGLGIVQDKEQTINNK